MITLQRDGVNMEVYDDLQASAFEKNGYVRVAVDHSDSPKVEVDTADDPVPVYEPKRRGRKPKAEASV